MRYMIVEEFKHGDPRPVYLRFRTHGRLAPEGLSYIDSWVTSDLRRCYQIMECEKRELLDEWIARWSDIVDFEVHPIISSSEAAALVE